MEARDETAGEVYRLLCRAGTRGSAGPLEVALISNAQRELVVVRFQIESIIVCTIGEPTARRPRFLSPSTTRPAQLRWRGHRSTKSLKNPTLRLYDALCLSCPRRKTGFACGQFSLSPNLHFLWPLVRLISARARANRER